MTATMEFITDLFSHLFQMAIVERLSNSHLTIEKLKASKKPRNEPRLFHIHKKNMLLSTFYPILLPPLLPFTSATPNHHTFSPSSTLDTRESKQGEWSSLNVLAHTDRGCTGEGIPVNNMLYGHNYPTPAVSFSVHRALHDGEKLYFHGFPPAAPGSGVQIGPMGRGPKERRRRHVEMPAGAKSMLAERVDKPLMCQAVVDTFTVGTKGCHDLKAWSGCIKLVHD